MQYAFVSKDCVACGNCVKYCPLKAIEVYAGIAAKVDKSKCVGCKKCFSACPGGIIKMIERGGENEEMA